MKISRRKFVKLCTGVAVGLGTGVHAFSEIIKVPELCEYLKNGRPPLNSPNTMLSPNLIAKEALRQLEDNLALRELIIDGNYEDDDERFRRK